MVVVEALVVVGVVATVVVAVVLVVDGAFVVVVDNTGGTLLAALACVLLLIKGTILGAMVGFCTGCKVSITPTGPLLRSASLSWQVNSSGCIE